MNLYLIQVQALAGSCPNYLTPGFADAPPAHVTPQDQLRDVIRGRAA